MRWGDGGRGGDTSSRCQHVSGLANWIEPGRRTRRECPAGPACRSRNAEHGGPTSSSTPSAEAVPDRWPASAPLPAEDELSVAVLSGPGATDDPQG